MVRKPSREVDIDDIISSEILGEDPEIIALVMKIHLALEAILIEAAKTLPNDKEVYRLTFPAKTDFLERNGLITASQKSAYDSFNDFRNDFAHIFGHEVNLADILELSRSLENKGIDFSDSVGRYTISKAVEYYGGTLGVLKEIGWCILFDAAWCLKEAGGREIFADSV